MMYSGIDIDLGHYEEDNERLAEYEAELQKQDEEMRVKWYRKSGVPAKFFTESFDTFIAETEEEKVAKEKCVRFAENPKNRVLVLCGNNGNGKSHLGCAILRKNIYEGNGGEYITSSSLCIKYDSAIGFKAEMNREEVIRHYGCVAPLLVIDECSKYFLNAELEKFLLSTIVCMRYENNLPTVLIGNPTKSALIDFLGKAVYDRMTEVCTTIDFNWQSRRKSNRAIE